jgi:hypothetical protein
MKQERYALHPAGFVIEHENKIHKEYHEVSTAHTQYVKITCNMGDLLCHHESI